MINSTLNLTSGCDTTLSASITYAPLSNAEVSSVTVATALSVTSNTDALVVKGERNDLEIAGMGFSGSSDTFDFVFVCDTESGGSKVLSTSGATFSIESNTLIAVSNLNVTRLLLGLWLL